MVKSVMFDIISEIGLCDGKPYHLKILQNGMVYVEKYHDVDMKYERFNVIKQKIKSGIRNAQVLTREFEGEYFPLGY